MSFETENIEFKSQFTEEIYKEVIAFAKHAKTALHMLGDPNNAKEDILAPTTVPLPNV